MKYHFVILKKYKRLLNRQQFCTLRGQLLSGDIKGFEKGFNKIIGKEFFKQEDK